MVHVKLVESIYCENCEYEDRCNEEREAAAFARIPADADVKEVRAIIESPDYYEGITTTCWEIDKAVAMRLMPRSVATIQLHDPISEIVSLKGARLVTATMGERDLGLTESLIKTLTGGDTMTVRSLYDESFSLTSGS